MLTKLPVTVYLKANETDGESIMPNTWFITGAARGLGREIAVQALNEGSNIVATARNPALVEDAFAGVGGFTERGLSVALDVTDESQVATAVEKAMERFGRIDYLVNNAGRGLLCAVEEASAAEVEAVFATNVFGLLNVTRAVLPHMRKERCGHVINISSMGGFAQVPRLGRHGATKFAVEGLSEALAAELSPLGIHVTVVEPGSFRTDFLDASSLQTSATEIPDYAKTVGNVRRAAAANNHGQMNDPAKGAAAIYSAVHELQIRPLGSRSAQTPSPWSRASLPSCATNSKPGASLVHRRSSSQTEGSQSDEATCCPLSPGGVSLSERRHLRSTLRSEAHRRCDQGESRLGESVTCEAMLSIVVVATSRDSPCCAATVNRILTASEA